MKAPTKSIAVRFTLDDVYKMEKFVASGTAMNMTDYIRRSVREQMIRDATSMMEA